MKEKKIIHVVYLLIRTFYGAIIARQKNLISSEIYQEFLIEMEKKLLEIVTRTVIVRRLGKMKA